MFRYFHHHFKAAAPVVAVCGLAVGLFGLVRMAYGLASVGPSAGLLGVMGEGVDEFSLRVGAIAPPLSSLFSDANTWITVAALTATSVSVVSAFRQLAWWIQGPGDAGALVTHVKERAVNSIGVRTVAVTWGVVSDARTLAPLPLARVAVLDAHSRVLARTVADLHGRFGFRSPHGDLAERGGIGGIEAEHDGYYRHTQMHPVAAGVSAMNTDIRLDRRSGAPAPESSGPGLVSTVAFWTGVATVPAAFFILAPSPVAYGIFALFAASVIVRAVGSGSGRAHPSAP